VAYQHVCRQHLEFFCSGVIAIVRNFGRFIARIRSFLCRSIRQSCYNWSKEMTCPLESSRAGNGIHYD